MILYRVLLGDIYGHLTEGQIKDILFFPEIPYHRLDSEDGITERICMSESIEGCLTAIGWARLEKMHSDDDSIRVVILKFDSKDMDQKYLKTPEDLDDLVADAYLTREWWYELPIHPIEVEIKRLSYYDSGNIEYILPIHLRDVSILSEEDHQKYCENGKEVIMIEDLRWKDEIY